jgi:hypothetical protein
VVAPSGVATGPFSFGHGTGAPGRTFGQRVDSAATRRHRRRVRATRRIVVIVLLVQVAWALPLGLVLGVVLGPVYLLAFGGVALAVLAVLLTFMLRWQRVDAARERLLTTGTRVPAVLVSSRATGTRVGNRIVQAHTFEAREPRGTVRAEARALVHLPIGTPATIAYAATDPSHATVVEDLDALAAAEQPSWQELRQRETDRRRP